MDVDFIVFLCSCVCVHVHVSSMFFIIISLYHSLLGVIRLIDVKIKDYDYYVQSSNKRQLHEWNSCMKRWCFWGVSTKHLNKASHLTAFCALDYCIIHKHSPLRFSLRIFKFGLVTNQNFLNIQLQRWNTGNTFRTCCTPGTSPSSCTIAGVGCYTCASIWTRCSSRTQGWNTDT